MNLYHVTKFPPYFPFTLYCFYTKISSFIPVLTIGIVRDCFYLIIFYSEKFSTWILISLLSRSTARRGGICRKSKMTSKQPPFPQWLRGRNLLQISRRKFAHDINLVQICSNLCKIPWVPRWGVNCNTRVQFSKTFQPQSQKTHFGNKKRRKTHYHWMVDVFIISNLALTPGKAFVVFLWCTIV